MKIFNLALISLLFVLFAFGATMLSSSTSSTQNSDYLRLHIRANSNLESDQNIKFEIKNKLLNRISSNIASISSKEELEQFFLENKTKLENFVDEILLENNFNYKSQIELKNEYFPARSYNNTTLQSGFYDAIIINLGSGEGNNWWCVAYPPLCFMYESNNLGNITYKSKIIETINKFFNK